MPLTWRRRPPRAAAPVFSRRCPPAGTGGHPTRPCPPRQARLLRPDTTAGELGRDDPDVQVVVPGGPGPQVAVLAEVPLLARLQNPVGVAADEHAPSLAKLQVEVVCLEGDRAVGVAGDQRA